MNAKQETINILQKRNEDTMIKWKQDTDRLYAFIGDVYTYLIPDHLKNTEIKTIPSIDSPYSISGYVVAASNWDKMSAMITKKKDDIRKMQLAKDVRDGEALMRWNNDPL